MNWARRPSGPTAGIRSFWPLHEHHYCGVLAPNAALREAVTASAGPAGATLQLLEQARAIMGLPAASPAEPDMPSPLTNLRRAAARCWALLLVPDACDRRLA